MSIATKCDRCGATAEGLTPGVVFLNGEDVTGWAKAPSPTSPFPIDVCPECKDDNP